MRMKLDLKVTVTYGKNAKKVKVSQETEAPAKAP